MTALVDGVPDQAGDGLRVLLVDDHPLLAEVLGPRLLDEPSVVRVDRAETPEAARALVASVRPHVVLLDHRLAREFGPALLPELRRAVPSGEEAVVLVLSAGSMADEVVDALRLGVSGWIVVDGSVAELVGAMHAARRGEVALSPSLWSPVVRLLLGAAGVPDQDPPSAVGGRS